MWKDSSVFCFSWVPLGLLGLCLLHILHLLSPTSSLFSTRCRDSLFSSSIVSWTRRSETKVWQRLRVSSDVFFTEGRGRFSRGTSPPHLTVLTHLTAETQTPPWWRNTSCLSFLTPPHLDIEKKSRTTFPLLTIIESVTRLTCRIVGLVCTLLITTELVTSLACPFITPLNWSLDKPVHYLLHLN